MASLKCRSQVKATSPEDALLDEAARIMANADAVLAGFSEAIKSFRLANTISAKFPDAYFWIAKCQEVMGQKQEAKLNYQRAYGLDNSFTEAKEAADKLK